MKKLGLNIDTLQVQSFDTIFEERVRRGTVIGAADAVRLMGTRRTRCYAECTVCTNTNCFSDERTEIDCAC
jgi:hypothetical protein